MIARRTDARTRGALRSLAARSLLLLLGAVVAVGITGWSVSIFGLVGICGATAFALALARVWPEPPADPAVVRAVDPNAEEVRPASPFARFHLLREMVRRFETSREVRQGTVALVSDIAEHQLRRSTTATPAVRSRLRAALDRLVDATDRPEEAKRALAEAMRLLDELG